MVAYENGMELMEEIIMELMDDIYLDIMEEEPTMGWGTSPSGLGVPWSSRPTVLTKKRLTAA